MLKKVKIITLDFLREYGREKGSYMTDAPIVDFENVCQIDYWDLNKPSNDYFKWIDQAVLKKFDSKILYEQGDLEDDEEENEIMDYDERNEIIEDDEEDEEFLDNENNTARTILEKYIDQLPEEVNDPLRYMFLLDGNMPYKVAICMNSLSNEQRFDIFKEWIINELINRIEENVFYREDNEYQKDVIAEIDDVINYLDWDKDYELIFNMLISMMYVYRLIFALIEHSDEVYDHIANQLFRIWSSIEVILPNIMEDKTVFDETACKIKDYLHIFEESIGLSILDSKICLTTLVLGYKINFRIIENLSETTENYRARRYIKLAEYVFSENNSDLEAEELYESMDETNKVILSDLYNKYGKYEHVININEDIRHTTQNKELLRIVLETLENVYEELDMDNELLGVYYQQLENGEEYAFSYIYNYIVRQNNLNKDEELEKLLTIAKENLPAIRYFECLVDNELYDKCIDFIKRAKSGKLISHIYNRLHNIQCQDDNSNATEEFLKQAFETLSKNQSAMRISRIRTELENYI